VGSDEGGADGGAGSAGGAGGAAGPLRVAVCITGQLSRLELASKIANLLRPTAAASPAPAALHVFLALERGTHSSSNLVRV
jgi:hypothetical protein